MKEYLVHIETKDKDNSHEIIFRSSTLTVLFLAIDDFRKAISNAHVSDTSIITDAQSILESLSTNFESQLTTVDEQDQYDEQQEENSSTSRARQEPRLKIAFPGAE
jgi:hypothetical protein